VLSDEDVKKRFEGAGAIARLSTPEELGGLVERDVKSFRQAAQKAGLEAK
jgi:tripartite-type tricarboxylate transporter receptor subunit TctC